MNENLLDLVVNNLIEGISIGFLASIPLGPIGVLCIQRTVNKGRMSGFVSGLGAASSDLIYAIIAGFSIGFITQFVEEQKVLIAILGALFLIGLGLKIFFTDPAKQFKTTPQKRSLNLWQDYISTFFLTVTNPFALFLFMMAFSIVGGERTFYMQLLMLSGVFLGAGSWWAVLTQLVGLFRKKLTIKRLYYFNKTAGLLIIVLVIVTTIVEFIKYIVE